MSDLNDQDATAAAQDFERQFIDGDQLFLDTDQPPLDLDQQINDLESQRAAIVLERDERLARDQREQQGIAEKGREIEALKHQKAVQNRDQGIKDAWALCAPNQEAARRLVVAFDAFNMDNPQALDDEVHATDDTFLAQMKVKIATIKAWGEAFQHQSRVEGLDGAKKFESDLQYETIYTQIPSARCAWKILSDHVWLAESDPPKFQLRKGLYVAIFDRSPLPMNDDYEAYMRDAIRRNVRLDKLLQAPGEVVGPFLPSKAKKVQRPGPDDLMAGLN